MTYPPQPGPSWPPVDPAQPSVPPTENSYELFDSQGPQPDTTYPPTPDPYGQYGAPYAPPMGPPARSERAPAVLVAVGIGLALLGLVVILVTPKTFFQGSAPDSAGAIPAAEATTVDDLAGGPFAGESGTPSGQPSAQPSASAKPERRDLPARTLVGPGFAAGEQTYEMKLTGMPFAFNTPSTWGCLRATIDGLPDAMLWRCIDEQAGSGRPQIDLAAVRCAGACTAADRDNLDRKAMSTVPGYTTRDATTRYAERTDAGKYLLTVNHTFAVNGQNWVLLADGEASKAEHKPGVQKTINDIWSQTP
jgi:hypothetical protein